MQDLPSRSATRGIWVKVGVLSVTVLAATAEGQDLPSRVSACDVRARLFGVQVLGQAKVVEIDPLTGNGQAVSGEGLNAFVRFLALDPETLTLYGIRYANELVSIDRTTGTLNSLGFIVPGAVHGLAFDTATDMLLGVDHENETLFSVDPATLTRTEISNLQGTPMCALAPDPENGLIYGSSCDSHNLLLTLDLSNSEESVVGSFGTTILDHLAFDSIEGRLLGITGIYNQLFAIAPASAALTPQARFALDVHAGGFTFDPSSGLLYATDFSRQQLARIDPRNGSMTTVGALGYGGMTSLTFDNHTRTLYGEYDRALATVDQALGEGTTTVPLGFPGIRGFAYDSSRGIIYGSDTNRDVLVSIDPQTGNATPIGRMGGQFVGALAFDPATSTLYGVDSPHLITINTRTGYSKHVNGVDSVSVSGLAFDTDERVLFGVTGSSLQKIDLETGSVTFVGDLGINNVGSLTFDSASDTLYGIDAMDGHILVINQRTGQATTIASLPAFSSIVGAAFDPTSGTLFGADISSGRLVQIDPLAGTGMGVGWYAFTSSGMAYNPSDRYLYALRDSDLLKICPRSGIGVTVGPTGVYFGIGGLAFDASGTSLYGTRSGLLYLINTSTGAATLVGGVGSISTTALSFDPISGQLYSVSGDSLLTINAMTGASTVVGDIGFSLIRGLAFATNDCNGNGVDDACDIADAFSCDGDGNGIPDECDSSAFLGDADGNGTTDVLVLQRRIGSSEVVT